MLQTTCKFHKLRLSLVNKLCMTLHVHSWFDQEKKYLGGGGGGDVIKVRWMHVPPPMTNMGIAIQANCDADS